MEGYRSYTQSLRFLASTAANLIDLQSLANTVERLKLEGILHLSQQTYDKFRKAVAMRERELGGDGHRGG